MWKDFRNRIHFRTNISSIFDDMGIRIILQFDEGLWGGFPGFGKKSVVKNFR